MKKKADELLKSAEGYLDMSFAGFVQSVTGIYIPKHMEAFASWQGKKPTMGQPKKLTMAEMVKASNELSDAQAKLLADHMKEAFLTGTTVGQSLPKITLDDVVEQGNKMIADVVKYNDYQQVPKHVADDAAIAPQVHPLDIKKIAQMLMNKEYTQDATGAAHFKDGTVLSNQMLESPSFTQLLKTATVQLTAAMMAAEKQAKFGGQTAPPPANGLSSGEKLIVNQLGLTEEEYLKWVNSSSADLPDKPIQVTKTPSSFKFGAKELRARLLAGEFEYLQNKDVLCTADGTMIAAAQLKASFYSDSDRSTILQHLKKKMPIVHGQWAKLLQPGLAQAMKDQQKTLDKLMNYAQAYGMDPADIASLTEEIKPQRMTGKDRMQVLEAIVSAILLSPKSLKMDDGQFVVPPEVLVDLHKTLRLKVVYDPKTNNYIASLE